MISTASDAPQPLLDLPRLVAGIRWRRRIWASVALLGLLVGVALVVLLPPRPTAVVQLMVIHENDQPSDVGSLMNTDLAVLHSTRVATAALARLKSPEHPAAFVETYEGVGLTSNVLELTVEGSSGRDAVSRARALAEAFIADHVGRTTATADAEALALTARRDEAKTELDEVDKAIAEAPDDATGTRAAEFNTLYARRADLASQISDLARRADVAAVGVPRVAAGTQILDAPRAVSYSKMMAAGMNGLFGLVLGLTVGLGLAAIATVVADRPVLRREIAAHLGASVIAQLAAPRRGLRGLWSHARRSAERERAAASLSRVARDDPAGVSVLELGCPKIAAALAMDMGEQLAGQGPVLVVDDLPDGHLDKLAERSESAIRILGVADLRSQPAVIGSGEHRLGVGSVRPGTAWTDLPVLGSRTVLVVRAGHASTLWLHTVARQLADTEISIIGVVLVHPDPRDRTDGTLWDAMQTALRGRVHRTPATQTDEPSSPEHVEVS